jgi:predicted TIM-barrel fold metal-dependent hydrolase
VIDAHVHHWELRRFRYPWLDAPEFANLRADYRPADYRADVEGTPVEGWVHIQAEVDHAEDPVAETAWVAELADDALRTGVPGPVACVVYADLRAPDLAATLTRHLRHPLTRGVRQELWCDPASTRADIPRDDLLADPRWREGYRTLGDHGLSFDVVAWPAQLPQVATVAAEAPDVAVVLDHFGMPDPAGDPGLRTWRAGVSLFAQLPHAFVKLSAISLLGLPRDERAVRSIVDELLDRFGPGRCMVGSNFPVERLAGGFSEVYRIMAASLRELSVSERADVLGGTARRFYRTARATAPSPAGSPA